MGLPEFSTVPLTVRMQKRLLLRRIVVQAFNASALTAVTLLCVEHFVPGGFQGLARQSLAVPALLKPAAPEISPDPAADRLPDLRMPAAPPRTAAPAPSRLPEDSSPPAASVRRRAGASETRPADGERWGAKLRRVDWLRQIGPGGEIGSRFWNFGRSPKNRKPGQAASHAGSFPDGQGSPQALRLDAPIGGGARASKALPGTIPLGEPRIGSRGVIHPSGPGAPDATTAGESADVHRMRAASDKLSRDLARRTLLIRWASAGAAGLAWFLLFFTLSGAPRALAKPWGGHQH